MKGSWRRRAIPGMLVILAHLVAVAILLRYAASPSIRDEGPPARYIIFALVPEANEPEPVKAAAPSPPPAPRPRRAAQGQDRVAPSVALNVPPAASPQEAAHQQAAPQPAVAQGSRLNMDALRADARRIARDHVPEPFEQVRDAEHRLEAEKKDLGRAISSAKREPCTKKYSGGPALNVFALIPLAIDTITDTGCKW